MELEQNTKAEIAFTLHERDSGTIVLMVCNDPVKQKELRAWFDAEFSSLTHHTIAVTEESTSLLHEMGKLGVLGQAGSPIEHCCHVEDLGKLTPPTLQNLLENANIGREEYFKQPYNIVLWVNRLVLKQMLQYALDFYSWVFYQFFFEESAQNSG